MRRRRNSSVGAIVLLILVAGNVGLAGTSPAGAASAWMPARYWQVDAAGNPWPQSGSPLPPGVHFRAPIVGMAALSGGDGYWLVAADGGVFLFGSAPSLDPAPT